MKKRIVTVLLLTVFLIMLLPSLAFAAGATKAITNSAELTYAINNQADGETWIIKNGFYDVGRFSGITVGGQTNWYFPITANNLTIQGESKNGVVLTSSVFSTNGAWASQDYISVWGDGVTIKNVTIKCKLSPNKTIEVMGKDFTLENAKIIQRDDLAYQFGGSIYFNPQDQAPNPGDIGNALIKDVLINDAWISCNTSEVIAGELILCNVTLDYRDCEYAPLGYGVISNNPGIIKVGNCDGGLLVRINEPFKDFQAGILDRVPPGTVVLLPRGDFAPLGNYIIPGDITVIYEGIPNPQTGEKSSSLWWVILAAAMLIGLFFGIRKIKIIKSQ